MNFDYYEDIKYSNYTGNNLPTTPITLKLSKYIFVRKSQTLNESNERKVLSTRLHAHTVRTYILLNSKTYMSSD